MFCEDVSDKIKGSCPSGENDAKERIVVSISEASYRSVVKAIPFFLGSGFLDVLKKSVYFT